MSQVIVVGGGLAGLSAAHTVLERGGNVLLLDKQGYVIQLLLLLSIPTQAFRTGSWAVTRPRQLRVSMELEQQHSRRQAFQTAPRHSSKIQRRAHESLHGTTSFVSLPATQGMQFTGSRTSSGSTSARSHGSEGTASRAHTVAARSFREW